MTAYKIINTNKEQNSFCGVRLQKYKADPSVSHSFIISLLILGSILSFLCRLYPGGVNGAFVQTQSLHVFPRAILCLEAFGNIDLTHEPPSPFPLMV